MSLLRIADPADKQCALFAPSLAHREKEGVRGCLTVIITLILSVSQRKKRLTRRHCVHGLPFLSVIDQHGSCPDEVTLVKQHNVRARSPAMPVGRSHAVVSPAIVLPLSFIMHERRVRCFDRSSQSVCPCAMPRKARMTSTGHSHV